ncbi:TIM21-domain-containing protein [Lenzites betulinus]|nr:TIM21-domain-containing protein [Lenzites betulinus]
MMNLPRTRSVLHRALRLCTPCARPTRIIVLQRTLATHAQNVNVNPQGSASGSKPTAASLLSNALDQRQRSARREDSAGPFQLGITPPRPGEVAPEKKWSELSAGGKVMRTTARTTNLAVILAGAGLSIVLIYALTSELFSRNSPTVLYNKACGLIKDSPLVHQYLQEPIVFHNHPPTVSRPRHRNHYVSSQIFVDSQGREHMLLNFYVQGRAPGSGPAPAAADDDFFSRATQTVQEKVTALHSMSWEEAKEDVEKRAERVLDMGRGVFRFLSGEEVAKSKPPPMPVQEHKQEQEKRGWLASVTGLFSDIKGSSRNSSGSASDAWNGPAFTEGEVHADLVMNDQGYYDFRYLLIDMPNSNLRNPRRIFVQRAEGVRETEPIVRWYR